jgi:hypothetical protein
MDPDKRRILNAKLAQRHGWYWKDGLWHFDQPQDCEERMPTMIDGPKGVDFWMVEELLQRLGWRFEFCDGLFVALRVSDGFRIRRYSRNETIAVAYIVTEIGGPTRNREYVQHPRWPAGMQRQSWTDGR